MSNNLQTITGLGALPIGSTSAQLLVNKRNPNPTDWQNQQIGNWWLNSITQQLFVLVSLGGTVNNPTYNYAVWAPVVSGTGDVQTLTGDDAVRVFPFLANINVIANTQSGSSVEFTGTVPNTITLNVSDTNDNTLIGLGAGRAGITGGTNTGLGSGILSDLTSGNNNCGLGSIAMELLTSGSNNTAAGTAALKNLVTGSNNISIGKSSGSAYVASESSNILVGSPGVVSESNVIRIGVNGSGAGQQGSCYIAGIDGVNVASTATVVTEHSNQLGTAVITAGSGISVTPGANTITIAATGSSGALQLIATKTAAAVTSLVFNNTNITNTYNNYFITYNSAINTSSAGNVNLFIQLSTNNGVSFLTTGYGSGGSAIDGFTFGRFLTNGSYGAGTGYLLNLTSGSGYIQSSAVIVSATDGTAGNTAVYTTLDGAYLTSGTVANAIRFASEDGNAFSGIFSLYGLLS